MCFLCPDNPTANHDDSRSLTALKLKSAADAAGMTVPALVRKMVSTVEAMTVKCPTCAGRGYIVPSLPGIPCPACKGTGKVISAEQLVTTNPPAPSVAKSTRSAASRGAAPTRKAPLMATTSASTKAKLQADMSAVAERVGAKVAADKARAKAAKAAKLQKQAANNHGTMSDEDVRSVLGRAFGADLRDLPADFSAEVVKRVRTLSRLERDLAATTDPVAKSSIGQQLLYERFLLMNETAAAFAMDSRAAVAKSGVPPVPKDVLGEIARLEKAFDAEKTDPVRKAELSQQLTYAKLYAASGGA